MKRKPKTITFERPFSILDITIYANRTVIIHVLLMQVDME